MTDPDEFKKNASIFTKKAAKSFLWGTAKSACSLGKRVCIIGKEATKFVYATHKKDYFEQAEAANNLKDEVFVKTAKGLRDAGKQFLDIAEDIDNCTLERNPVLREKRLQKTINKSAVFIGAVAAGAVIGNITGSVLDTVIDIDAPEVIPACLFLPDVDIDTIPGIENHFVYENADINALSALGMKSELINNRIDSDLIDRSESVKIKFVHSIGRTEIPDGYEIHHVVPLSQGGLDDPRNMVLISEKDHDYITNQHRKFYGW